MVWKKKFMHNFGLLLASSLFIMLLGCVPQQINSISTITPQALDNPCAEANHSNPDINISPANVADLTVNEVRSEIESYLDAGGSASGLQPLILDTQNNVIGSIMEIDLNDNGIKEIVLSTTTASRVDVYNAGWVGIYECKMGKYSASYAELGGYIEYAKVKSIVDLLDTGSPQIYIEYKWDGGGCLVGLQVLGNTSGNWSWVFGNYLNCPATVSMRVNQTTGKTEIIYEGILRDWTSNEPDKEVTQIYMVNNGEFQLQP
jgi:hypothetical protein